MIHRHHPRQRGTVYLLVLAVTSMLVAIGVTAAMVGRIDVKSHRLEADQQQARALALGAIEVIRLQLETNPGWRTSHTHGVWTVPANTRNGAYRYNLADPSDADLADDATDAVVLTVEATAGDAVRLYSVTLRDGKTLSGQFAVVRSSDDADQTPTLGTMSTISSDALIGQDGLSSAMAGVRFDNLPLTPGCEIVSAAVQFTSRDARASATSITIWGEAQDDASTFSALLFNISGRTKTTRQVAWAPGGWDTGDRSAAQRTPDLAAIVQEIVGRPGWRSGNAVAFILEGTQGRNIRTFDHSSATCPVLYLTYTAPGLTADYTTLRRELAP